MTGQRGIQPRTSPDSRHDIYALLCPGRAVFELLANKWTGLAITALEDGPRRFGELRRKLEGVSPKVLTQTLRRLEDHGLVLRTVYAEVPPRVEYELTPLGRSALEPLAHLRTWVRANTGSLAGEGAGVGRVAGGRTPAA
ncbi:winged helix-turn-helix transcriptional regulator [Streptomyces violens]|uniref:winged helix-turn-helix transcriptional regulator n=1 Tax=Streptomyces violens TaxID=66377 RepID=UPI000996F6E6|nr:helix-turn-helix domain-containing protein [Streptomyces violens]